MKQSEFNEIMSNYILVYKKPIHNGYKQKTLTFLRKNKILKMSNDRFFIMIDNYLNSRDYRNATKRLNYQEWYLKQPFYKKILLYIKNLTTKV